MKEFNYLFSDGLSKGLTQYRDNPFNVQGLLNLLNMKVYKTGLVAFSTITNIPTDLTISWPFPQIFLGSKYCFIANSTDVYNIPFNFISGSLAVGDEGAIEDEFGDDILDELGDAITWTSIPELSGLPSGTFWDFADFGKFCILTNGSIIVFMDNETDPSSPTLASMYYSGTFPRCSTYCNFKGQLIGANVKTSWHDCDSSSIVWAKIGTIDFTPVPSGEAGYKIVTEFKGDIYKVKRLEDIVMVYGADGIMTMFSKDVSYGFNKILDVGIPSIKAIAGNKSEHVFVDNLLRLWKIKKDYKLEKLDYRDHLSNLTKANIVISYDRENEEYYITDGVRGYLLTSDGLSEVYQLPTSIINVSGSVYGVCKVNTSTGFLVETDVIDFGLCGYKTIVAIELGIKHAGALYCQVGWKSTISGSFVYAPAKLVNPNGVVYPNVTGDKFKIKIYSTTFANIHFDYMTIRLNLTDKRSVRGRINVT